MATDKTKLPGLKPIPSTVDKELAGSLKAMHEILGVHTGQRGHPLDRAVTVRELIDSGMAKELNDNPFDPNAGTGPSDFAPIDQVVGDLSIPPAPISLTASAAFTAIILDWNGTSASAPYGNHAFTEIWRSRDNNLAGATLRATTNAFIYTDEVGYDETYYYWVRYVSTNDVQGPFNNTNGVEATTLSNVSAVMTDLSETLANMPGYSVLTSADSTNASNIATVTSDVSTLQTTVSSHASTLTSHTSSINSNTSNVTSLTSTTSTINGNLSAMYVIKASVESNGSVSAAGMLIGANASSGSNLQSYVQFQADKFAIWSGSTNVAPFIVSGGTVFIDSARIQDGAITNARIANATIQSSKIANAAITTAKIADANITTAKIGNAQITTAKIADAQITDAKITGTLDSNKINVDTLNVKHFANVSADIINQTGGTVPLRVTAENSEYAGTYPGQTENNTEAVYMNTTLNNVRNGAGYQVVYSAVLGDTRNGTMEYSFNGTTWTALSPSMNTESGTFRTYVFIWQGTISGMSSSQETVYWRVNWNNSGSIFNSTYQSIYIDVDNTQ